MRILLIVPTFRYNKRYPSFLSISDFPAGYGYLAAVLKEAGHEVYGLNLNNITGYLSAFAMVNQKINQAIERIKPNLIGIGGICSDYKFIKDAIGIIRENDPDIPIVVGGGIITHDTQYIMNLLRPDFCIIGEAEKQIVQLADALGSGNYEHINNLGYWQNGKAIFTEKNFDYGDIDDLPIPDWEPFGFREMVDNYSYATRILYRYSRPYPRPMIVYTARGCPFNCSFCVHQQNRRYRARAIESIMQEIAVMYERYEFNILIIQDELFAANNKRMREFCLALIKAKEDAGWDFDWMMQTHANARLDYDTLKLAKKSGCYFFSYGLESASPIVLQSMNKKTKISQIIEAIDLANSVGIGFGGNLIFGDIAETEETVRETLQFLFRYGLDNLIFVGLVMPYPGSKIFDVCLERGVITDKLDFYENIDRLAYNMTRMPDEIWYHWDQFLVALEKSYRMLFKAANTTDYEIDTITNPIAEYYKQPMWKIRTTCPHCNRQLLFRERSAGPKNRIDLRFLVVGCRYCGKRFRVNLLEKPNGL